MHPAAAQHGSVVMQIRAIMMAACAARDAGAAVQPGIMVPLVSSIAEYEHQAQLIHTTAQDVLTSMGSMLEYEVGSMIETPRAALLAGDLAAQADFVSLGTNDLTQYVALSLTSITPSICASCC